jgi:hypothetical protein
MAVVTRTTNRRHLTPVLSETPAALPRPRVKPSLMLWLLMSADLATVIWMYTLGSWLDQTSKFTATATLGGHHLVVLIIAALAFLALATVAVLSDGFTALTPALTIAKNLACVISVIALTGLVALVLGALLSRLLFGAFRP